MSIEKTRLPNPGSPVLMTINYALRIMHYELILYYFLDPLRQS